MVEISRGIPALTVGLDLGDRFSQIGVGCRWGARRGESGGDAGAGIEAALLWLSADADCFGDGDAFAVGLACACGLWPRGCRGQLAQASADLRESQEVGQSGRALPGADGTAGSQTAGA